MFEHFSFRVPRYGEDAVRKNPFNRRAAIFCSPEFEEIFNNLFGGVDFGKLMKEATEEAFTPRVVRVPVRDEEPEETEKDEAPFRWCAEYDDEGDEDEEPVKVPPSIFDMLNSGKDFSDIVSVQPKHRKIYRQAFGLDENGRPIPFPDEDEKEDEPEEVKNPFVFISNRLTFLIQTMHPIIFDTSIIETGNNSMTIAVNVDKTFPKLDGIDGLGFITGECNRSGALQNEISTYLEGTDFDRIYCFPTTIERDDVEILAVKFVIYPKRKNYNFGPAFLNHNK